LRCSWFVRLQYSTVQYSTVQYSTVQYSTVQYSTVQYSTVQYSLHGYEQSAATKLAEKSEFIFNTKMHIWYKKRTKYQLWKYEME
jgi:hypothetical protein